MAIVTDTLVELEVEGGVRGLQGEKGDTGNGISSIAKTATSGNIDTYTIYFTDGNNTTYNVVNGDVDCTKDVRINGNSVMEDRIVDLQTEGDYDELTNKLVTLSDVPTRVSELVNDEHYIDADVNTLTNYTLGEDTGSSIELTMNSSTYVVTLNLKNADGDTISTGSIDLPIESVVVSGSYDSSTKEVVLTLQGGSTVRFSVADLVAGLQQEITSSNKLSSDLVDDTNKTNKFVTTAEKTTWNNKQNALTFDTTPTSGSTNPVTSGGIYTYIGDINEVIDQLNGEVI
jgi:hypothetical protein